MTSQLARLCEHRNLRPHPAWQNNFADYYTCPGGVLLPLDTRTVGKDALVIEKVDEFAGEFGLRLLRHDSNVSGLLSWQRAQAILLDMLDALALLESSEGAG